MLLEIGVHGDGYLLLITIFVKFQIVLNLVSAVRTIKMKEKLDGDGFSLAQTVCFDIIKVYNFWR